MYMYIYTCTYIYIPDTRFWKPDPGHQKSAQRASSGGPRRHQKSTQRASSVGLTASSNQIQLCHLTESSNVYNI